MLIRDSKIYKRCKFKLLGMKLLVSEMKNAPYGNSNGSDTAD